MSDVKIKGLKTFFHTREGVVKAVDDITFSIPPGEVVGLVGESGSGKSVTCHTLLQLLPSPPAKVEGGEIIFSGEDLLRANDRKMRKLRGKSISMIFQDPMSCLNPYMTVVEQVAEPLLIHKMASEEEARQQAIDMLLRVGVNKIKDRLNAYPHEFSGGMRQRAMIAMALITKPALLLADEPTTALDVTVQAKILKLLKKLCAELGSSILFVSHDLGVVAEIADRVVVMYRGKVVEQNTTQELFRSPTHPYVKALIACRPTFTGNLEILPTIEDFMGNLSPIPEKRKREKRSDPPAENIEDWIKVRDLSVHFRQAKQGDVVKAVDQVSLTIPRGKTLGIVGESGSGKTTLGRAILRLTPITSGKVQWQDQDIASVQGKDFLAFRKKMQIIFQDPYASLNPRLTIEQALLEPMQVHGIGQSRKERVDRVVSLLEEVGLEPDYRRRYPHEFSGGQRQRICVARALSTEPQFIVCDECVSAMDVSVQAQVLNLLSQLQAARGLTYLFISHDLCVVKHIADEIAVMRAGKIVESGNAESICLNPQDKYTQELMDSIPSTSRTGAF
jgi:peptide/nickel transport system ATP-binding protein